MNTSRGRDWTEAERSRLLTQDQADALPAGTMILFKNSAGPAPALEKVAGAKGDCGQPCSFLDDWGRSWLYNVGRRDDNQQVVEVMP